MINKAIEMLTSSSQRIIGWRVSHLEKVSEARAQVTYTQDPKENSLNAQLKHSH